MLKKNLALTKKKKKKEREKKRIQVMFGNTFRFIFSKICFWEYKEKKKILVFLK